MGRHREGELGGGRTHDTVRREKRRKVRPRGKRQDGRHRGGEESWTEEVGLEARQMREADVHHVRI